MSDTDCNLKRMCMDNKMNKYFTCVLSEGLPAQYCTCILISSILTRDQKTPDQMPFSHYEIIMLSRQIPDANAHIQMVSLCVPMGSVWIHPFNVCSAFSCMPPYHTALTQQQNILGQKWEIAPAGDGMIRSDCHDLHVVSRVQIRGTK